MTSSAIDFVRHGLVVAAVGYLLSLAPRLAPLKSQPSVGAGFTLEALNAKFKTARWFVGAAMLAAGMAIFFVLHTFLLMGQSYFASQSGPAAYVFMPSRAIWYFLPGFAAVCICWEMVLQLWGLWRTREEAELYRFWSDSRAGFNATKILRIMAVVIVLPIGAFTVLALPMHTSFDERGIATQGYASLQPVQYSYAEVRQISVVEGSTLRDGSFNFDPQVIVDFKDGQRWSTRDSRDPEKRIDLNFVAFISSRTRLSASNFHLISDIR